MILLQTPCRGNTARVEFTNSVVTQEQVKRLVQYLELSVDCLPSDRGFAFSDKAKQGFEILALHFKCT